ncbi:glycogen debranching enzyme GlgX [Aestuariivirga litoralis]|uniref:4-alpha-glucanotransferase n=1 Tax=Aestuariivirga litoralis TaxID=2650924 RepID=A0A2W2B885_9HYPH|nr:glycogen debranching protein GlgX [Aestuariivirga litoralis]PZF76504.1 glycogen debranching enzyme GlgX [Aestuariivirga litoralis]
MTDAARPFPLGVTPSAEGANAAVVSRHAERVFVSLFEGGAEVARVPLTQRLGDVHYGVVPGLIEGTRYGLRAEGPWAPKRGLRFDREKLLLDPYATQLTGAFRHLPELMQRGVETQHLVPKAIAGHVPADAQALPPQRPEFIYEIPVRGFTMLHPHVPPEKRGTVAALAEPVIIEHLKRLGADTVELMPLAAWIDERHLPALGLSNSWGYNPVSFLAPDPRLAPGGLAEIRATVDALHAAGIRVVLDVVLNHTGESDVYGTTLSLRGLDEALYYARAGEVLINDTGCGNTLALDEPAVMQLAMDSLRSWAMRTGIDGFRFDLATVMGRTASGFSPRAPLLAAIEQDPLLSRLTMIAEPWDVGPGGYQLGHFPPRWQEWNDRYRDEVRRFWRGDPGAGGFATRIAGSSDIFGGQHRPPSAGINFIAAHDGFTLHDCVTYAAKDNHANGEDNRDGNAHEPSWPGGDARALLATLFLSRGTPMLTAGDEFGRSQGGNNNAYAQDNEITWLDWARADERLIGFTAALVHLRRALSPFLADHFLTQDTAQWFGADGAGMDWQDAQATVLGLLLTAGARRLALVFNRGEARALVLPKREGRRWTRLFCSAGGEELPARSVCVFAEERIASQGVADAEVAALAVAAGIEPEWWEVDGTHHRVSLETQRALLSAMGLGFATGDDIEHAQAVLARPRPVITSPGTCFVPDDIASGDKVFGLASHLYALRHGNSEGIGDFATLQHFAALTARIGGRHAGLNPLHHMFPSDRSRASPYQPSDRHYVDPIYISIERLLSGLALPRTAALARDARAAFARFDALPLVDYAAVWEAKARLLESAFAEFPGSPAFDAFVAAGGEQLAAHGRFEALRMGEQPTPQRIAYRAFLQWVADGQLAEAARHGNLYGDLALGCAFDGGELAANPAAFARGVSIGAPPDPFSAAGQVWNLPPFSPLALDALGMEPIRRVIAASMRHAAALRIDHVLGLARQFWVPEGAEGRFGAYVRFPLDALLAVTAMESRRHRCLVVGEDLGTVPGGLRERLAAAKIFSYRVLWFEREGAGFKPAEAYPQRALACLASHDLPTFMGWRAGRDIEIAQAIGQIDAAEAAARKAERREEERLLGARTGYAGEDDLAASAAAHRFVAGTPAQIMLVQADDLAGERDPLNVPGTDREWPNWRRRVQVPVEELAQGPLARGILDAVKQEREA